MAWSAPIKLRPTAADMAISRACLRVATPAVERPLRVVTWLADEKIMLGAVGAFWAATRFSGSRPLRREADAMLCSVLIAGVAPDLFKLLVRREQPNRALVRRHDTRVPPSGNAWAALWGGLGMLAATRIMLLAHYTSDVAAGWGIGALINKAVCAALVRAERSASKNIAAATPLQPL